MYLLLYHAYRTLIPKNSTIFVFSTITKAISINDNRRPIYDHRFLQENITYINRSLYTIIIGNNKNLG
jgi:hypothetical protein